MRNFVSRMEAAIGPSGLFFFFSGTHFSRRLSHRLLFLVYDSLALPPLFLVYLR